MISRRQIFCVCIVLALLLFSAVSARPLTDEEKLKIQQVFAKELLAKLKQMFAISTRSRIG
jgi:hypothetical protein